LIWITSALLPSLRESNPAAAFGENFIALGIFYGTIVGCVALGIWLGPKIAEWSGRSWMGWGFGIGLFFVGALIQEPLAKFFGVSERLQSLMNPECYTDWDGRSNPTVCG
jgi:hypothetical protein